MQIRHAVPLLWLGVLLAGVVATQAAIPVQLELVGDAQGSALAFQEWAQVLGKAGIQNVRIREANESDMVGIRTEGTIDAPVYVVTGVVRSRDELLMPNGRMRPGDARRLADWIKDLSENGLPASRERKVAFGLTSSQFDRVQKDLAATVGFSTQNVEGQRIVDKLASQLAIPLRPNAEAAKILADVKVADELQGLSCGTALAYVLQSAGYGLAPRVTNAEPVYDITRLRPGVEVWPIGKADVKSPQEGLPGLYEFLNVNIQKVSAATALEAIGKRVKAPVVYDRAALAKHNLTPEKSLVSLPQSRTTYSLALRKLLFQAGLKFEVRYDEAGSPFLWITSVKPS